MWLSNTGIRLSLEEPWLSASADGKFTCDCHGHGVMHAIACKAMRIYTFYMLDYFRSVKYYLRITIHFERVMSVGTDRQNNAFNTLPQAISDVEKADLQQNISDIKVQIDGFTT